MGDPMDSINYDIPDEEGADLPAANAVTGAGVPTNDEIMAAAAQVVEAAKDRMAIELADWYKVDNFDHTLDGASDYYREIVTETRDPSQQNLDEYARQVAGSGGYFDDVPAWFKLFTFSDSAQMEAARSELRSAWEELDAVKNSDSLAGMYSDFDEWNGHGVKAFREGFVAPLRGAAHNQQLIIKALYSNLMVFQKLDNEARIQAKAIADATIANLNFQTGSGGSLLAPSLGMFSGLLGFAILLAAPELTAVFVYKVLAGAAGISAAGINLAKDSSETDPYDLWGSTVFEVMGKCSDRLGQLHTHISDADTALGEAMQSNMTDVEGVIRNNGYLQSGRFVLPTEPEFVNGDFDRDEFRPGSR